MWAEMSTQKYSSNDLGQTSFAAHIVVPTPDPKSNNDFGSKSGTSFLI
jgi:hypothetical protein